MTCNWIFVKKVQRWVLIHVLKLLFSLWTRLIKHLYTFSFHFSNWSWLKTSTRDQKLHLFGNLWIWLRKNEYILPPCTATKISLMYSFSENSGASAPIFTFMCLWAIYIVPGSVYNISSSRIGRLSVGIYKSLTDAWMWKLVLRPRYSFSGNICFEISVFCLCSEVLSTWMQLEENFWRRLF
jgi:hypothetical protein